MNGLFQKRTTQPVSYNPATMIENQFNGVPETWQHIMHVIRPHTGINICTMNGRPDGAWTFTSNSEAALSISFLLKGHITAAIENDVDLQVKNEQVVFMASNEALSGWDVFSGQQDFKLINIHITPLALQGLTGIRMADLLHQMRSTQLGIPHLDVCLSTMPLCRRLRRIATEIVHYQHQQATGPLQNMFLCTKAAEALATFIQQHLYQHGTASTLRALPTDRPKLVRAKRLIDKTYAENWSVPTLAHAVGLNEKRLQAGFQKLCGCTVHEYLIRTRLDAALVLLARGLTVTHTAQAVGFTSSSHFSKVFHQHVGRSPKRWATEWRDAPSTK